MHVLTCYSPSFTIFSFPFFSIGILKRVLWRCYFNTIFHYYLNILKIKHWNWIFYKHVIILEIQISILIVNNVNQWSLKTAQQVILHELLLIRICFCQFWKMYWRIWIVYQYRDVCKAATMYNQYMKVITVENEIFFCQTFIYSKSREF